MVFRGACSSGALLALSLLLAQGTATGRVEQPQGGGTTLDVCALLPRDKAMQILGRKVLRTRPAKRPDGQTECRYSGGLEGTITIVVGAGVSKTKWDAFMKELTASGAKLEPVTGVGDGANFWDDRLYAHTGTYEVTVSTSPTPDMEQAKTRADAIALAKAVIAKLSLGGPSAVKRVTGVRNSYAPCARR
jgi:hypothetical protein